MHFDGVDPIRKIAVQIFPLYYLSMYLNTYKDEVSESI
jgi:hypothetical protein